MKRGETKRQFTTVPRLPPQPTTAGAMDAIQQGLSTLANRHRALFCVATLVETLAYGEDRGRWLSALSTVKADPDTDTLQNLRKLISGAQSKIAERYDALTLEVERADALTKHLGDRLSDLSEDGPGEAYALSLIAENIRQRHALVVEAATALREAGDEP